MTPESMLGRINRDLDESGENRHGGVIYMALDRDTRLCESLGFSGIFNLVRQLRTVLADASETPVEIVRFGLSTLVLRVPSNDSGDIRELARDLFERVGEHSFSVKSRRVALTVSMSMTRFDRRFADADELLLALAGKVTEMAEEGGNRLAFVEPVVSSSEALDSDQHMLGLLSEALRNDSLRVVFQSLLAISGDESHRVYQMLPRLEAGDGELIAAAEFIPVARESKLLPVLDRWMLVHAARLLRGPLKDENVCLFVNQSDALFTDPQRRAWLLEMLDESPALHQRVVVEFSLHDALVHLDSAASLLEEIRRRKAGVCLSRVDDHSRWDLLGRELECDYLRVSPDFVGKLVQSPKIEKRFMDLVAPVRKSGARIIMPRVEDSQTAATLWRCGADYMQGNMIQAPEDTIAI